MARQALSMTSWATSSASPLSPSSLSRSMNRRSAQAPDSRSKAAASPAFALAISLASLSCWSPARWPASGRIIRASYALGRSGSGPACQPDPVEDRRGSADARGPAQTLDRIDQGPHGADGAAAVGAISRVPLEAAPATRAHVTVDVVRQVQLSPPMIVRHHPAPVPAADSNASEQELMQYLSPVGAGPSSKT